MGMINFLYTMGKIAIAKAKSEKESPNIYRLGKYKELGKQIMDLFFKTKSQNYENQHLQFKLSI